jgi:hypothetical protein
VPVSQKPPVPSRAGIDRKLQVNAAAILDFFFWGGGCAPCKYLHMCSDKLTEGKQKTFTLIAISTSGLDSI